MNLEGLSVRVDRQTREKSGCHVSVGNRRMGLPG